MSTVERQQLRPPRGSHIWIPAADAFPQGKILLWGPGYSKMFLGEGPSPGLPWGPKFKFHLKTGKSKTCHSSLPKAAHLRTTGPQNTSAQVISEPCLSQTETGHHDWTNAVSEPKQENGIYKGYFPPLLRVSRLVLISIQNYRLHTSFSGWEREPTMLVQHYRTDSILHMPFEILTFLKKKRHVLDYQSWITLIGWVWQPILCWKGRILQCAQSEISDLQKSEAIFPMTTQRTEYQPASLP